MKKVIVYIVIVVTILIFAISARTETEFIDAIGEVLVDEEINGVLYAIEEVEYNLWLIPVKTEYGIIRFYSDIPEWEGRVYLLLFGEDYEVIDAFMIETLEAPFGELSFFYFYEHSERRCTYVHR